MPFSGAGGIWTARTGDFVVTNQPGDAAGLAAAKAYAAVSGGFVELYPGTEGLSAGVMAANVCLVRVRNDGRIEFAGLTATDIVDPTRALRFVLTGVSTGTIRTATAPDWSGVLLLPTDFGLSGQFLRSNGAGVQPTWATITLTNALLDGANHTDTLAGAVARGDLIVGNSTPRWARLALGASGTVLASNGTDAAWTANPAVQHDTLAHIKAVRATGCGVVNGTATLTTSAGQFANVRVGDRVNFDIATTSLWGAAVSALIDSNNVTLDRTNTGSTVAGAVCVITPGDHYNSAITEPNGYFIAQGRGDHDASATPGGTKQEIRGSINWQGYEPGHQPEFALLGSTSVVTPFGLKLKKGATGFGVYFMVNAITQSRVLTIPDASDEVMLVGTTPASGDVVNKTIGAAVTIKVDETGAPTNGAVFADRANPAKRLGFNLTQFTPSDRVATWQDRSGTVAYLDDPIGRAYAPGSFTLSTGRYMSMVKSLRLISTQRATLEGDARLVIEN